MNGSFWKPSEEQRRTILLLEALGLIHDLGKLSDRFLQSHEPSSTLEYNHNLLADPRQVAIYRNHQAKPGDKAAEAVLQWLSDTKSKSAAFGERFDLTTILEKIRFTDWDGERYSFAELVPMVASFGLAKETADWKGVLGKDMRPGLLVGHLHGIAHFEKKGEPDKHKQPYCNVFRATPFGLEEQIETGVAGELTTALNALPLADIGRIASSQRRDLLQTMKTGMRRGLADNRRPHNEVSLWDWGYTVASMTKAAASWIFKNGWPTNLDDLAYRTLSINLDMLERYTRSDKISDLLGVRQALNEAFSQVQTLLEETVALGNCFYHDETGAYYLFSDLLNDEEMAALRQEIQAQFPPDLRPQVHLGERITTGELYRNKALASKLVAGPRAQAAKADPVRADNNLYPFETEWTNARPENAEICMVCGVRPVGFPPQGLSSGEEGKLEKWATQDKAERRNVCRICLDRRGRRAEQWATAGLQSTIWTDEVADNHGRMALVVGKLGLEGWLDGTLLSTIQVTSSTSKLPSPVRLYRVAEAARAFWEKVRDKLTPDVIPRCPFRLALYLPPNSLPDLGDFHAYELDVNGVALSVVWDKPNARFLTADNLTYFADRCGLKQEEITSRVERRGFQVLEPSAFLRPDQPLVETVIERVERLDGYQPVIPLLAEPSVCLMLVPADKAVALARAVKREYEEQMGRVRDRLPIYLGLVFCPRRTPIRALLEAGRAMLSVDGGEKWVSWRLTQNNVPNPGERELVFDNGITWRVPVLAGDCITPDDWYPRWYSSGGRNDTWRQARPEHVANLRVPNQYQPWKVWVQPSRFDFEFLDATGRRFEIYYDSNCRRPRRTRPFYLEDLDRLDTLWELMSRLAVSQRHQVISTIEATRETWYGQGSNAQSGNDEVFKQFVADTLAGTAWPKGQSWNCIPQEWRDKLIQAGVSSELADLAELHMEILKER